MLRKGSLFPRNASHCNFPRISDCLVKSWGVIQFFDHSKTIQFKERRAFVAFPWHKDSKLCPCPALLRSNNKLALSSSPENYIFTFRVDGVLKPLTYQDFSLKLRFVLQKLHLSVDQYSGHSFRRGGATHGLCSGVPAEIIKAQGDWKSLESYLDYLDITTHEDRAKFIKLMYD